MDDTRPSSNQVRYPSSLSLLQYLREIFDAEAKDRGQTRLMLNVRVTGDKYLLTETAKVENFRP
jgi:hypothetical protein